MASNIRIQSFAIFLIVLIWIGVAVGQWSNDPSVNTPISRSILQEWNPEIVSDGADGAIIVWGYYTSASKGYDIAAQRIDAGGYVKWTSAADISSTTNDQKDYRVISDGAGGAIIVWTDRRSDYDIYAQRVDASGNVKWTADGVVICEAASIQAYPDLVSDGAGGAIITWRDSRNYSSTGVDIYAQRINSSGAVQWTANGKAVCTASGDQMDPRIVTDGSGGAVITWYDDRDASTGDDIYAQRINSSGTAQWTANGVGYKASGNQIYPTIVSDGSGGAIIAWQEDYMGATDLDIRCLRINSSGTFPWSPNSTWVCGSGNNQVGPQAVTDGAGGAIIVWTDYRNGTSNPDIYVDRIDISGVSKWAGWGKVVCNATDRQIAPKIIADVFGGAIITWMDERTDTSDIYAQRIYPNGNFVWKSNGVEISTAKKAQNTPELTLAGSCGAIITWCDLRWVGDPSNDTDWDIYAQRVYADGYLIPSMITVDAPNGGENWTVGSTHNITWHCQNFSDPVKIEYSTDGAASYTTIVASYNNTGSYSWTIPNTPSTLCCVKISDAADSSPFDISDAVFTISATSGDNTPVGTNVTVDLGNGVQVIFAQVSVAGTTNLNITSTGYSLPPGKAVLPVSSPVFYMIKTTATITGDTKIRIQYNPAGISPDQEMALKLMGYEDPQWKDITTSLDHVDDFIYGEFSNLSLFAVMYPTSGTGGALTVTNCDDSGTGSLRNAIESANTHIGPDTINFAIPKGVTGHDATDGVWRIFPLSQLPTITDHQLLINGFSQHEFIGEDSNPLGPEIVINGASAGDYISGLVVTSSGVTIMGLTINNFYSNGIWLDYVDGGRISGCYIGTDYSGLGPAPNGYGIWIGKKSQFVVIAPMDTFRNVISGNTNGGIFVSDTSHHVNIVGNIIGLDRKGMAPLGNGNYGGVIIQRQCDSVAVFDNWIGGNKYGVYILESSRNLIQNNWIGVVMEHLFPGTGNEFDGVHIADKSYDNRIIDNHIWFNKGAGMRIYGDQPYRNRISHNSIARNDQSGILYDSGGANVPPQPVISNVNNNSVSGSAMPNATIEIYTDSGNQGEIFQGETMSDPSGNFHWTGMIQGPFSNVTVLAIDAQGNTSVFSKFLTIDVESMELNRLPQSFLLLQNYPNPFNPETVIEYQLPRTSEVEISIYNLQGQKITTLIKRNHVAGNYKVSWRGIDESNRPVTSGIYLYQLKTDQFAQTKKMLLLR